MKIKVAFFSIIALFIACSSVDMKSTRSMESNDLAYRLRYTDVSASQKAAKEAFSSASESSDKAEALNNMAYVAYQQMRFDQALHLLQRFLPAQSVLQLQQSPAPVMVRSRHRHE